MAAERTIAASTFKAECLALLDEVAMTGQAIVVTKRGKPVARIVPIEPPPSLLGSVTILVDDEELLFSTGDRWNADED